MARFSKARREALELKLRPLIEEQNLQQHKAALLLGVSEDWIQRACMRLQINTQRTGPRSGAAHPDWTGGVILIKGYRFVYAPHHPNKVYGRYMAEHRLVAEQILGRLLTKREVVHHKDKNRLNNDPENLQVFSCNSEHLKEELTGHVPQWTDAGKRRISEGVRKAIANRTKLKSCDGRRTQSNAHQRK